MTGFDKKIYDVYSKKHDVRGQIIDYGVVIKLQFTYAGIEREIALKRPFPDNGQEAFLKLGTDTIDSFIEKLSGEESRKLMLHYWYVDENTDDATGEKYMCAHGIVTGHNRIADTHRIHTSEVFAIEIDRFTGEVLIHTRNSLYHCPLAYCDYDKQDEFPLFIPDYEIVKAKYKDKRECPSIEAGKVLVVLSNFDRYYFHSLYYLPEGACEKAEYRSCAHIGTFQDSYLIWMEEQPINLSYFPHFQNIEFYSQETDGKPLYLENIGDVPLYARTFSGTICLQPGERKEVTEENAEENPPMLPKGDLYPAGIIE